MATDLRSLSSEANMVEKYFVSNIAFIHSKMKFKSILPVAPTAPRTRQLLPPNAHWKQDFRE